MAHGTFSEDSLDPFFRTSIREPPGVNFVVDAMGGSSTSVYTSRMIFFLGDFCYFGLGYVCYRDCYRKCATMNVRQSVIWNETINRENA